MQNPLEPLTAVLGRLPGLGRRSAERAALALLKRPEGLMAELIAALEAARRTVRCCSLCGGVTDARSDPCRLCTDPDRDATRLCVVEEPGDILAIERSGAFRGRYHALMGRLSPARRMGPEDLRADALLARIKTEGIAEVVLALNTDMDGDATMAWIGERVAALGVTVSRPALGLPVDSGVRYSDPVTLKRALQARQRIG